GGNVDWNRINRQADSNDYATGAGQAHDALPGVWGPRAFKNHIGAPAVGQAIDLGDDVVFADIYRDDTLVFGGDIELWLRQIGHDHARTAAGKGSERDHGADRACTQYHGGIAGR